MAKEKINLYRNLKYHLPVPTDNCVFKLNFLFGKI